MKNYKVILADPPWRYDNSNPPQGACTYPTMTMEDIKALPVNQIADKDCALFMWATMPKLVEALELIDAWGFHYRTCAFTWVKLNPTGELIKEGKDISLKKGLFYGLGHWTRGNAEICLFAKTGRPQRRNKGVEQIVLAPRGRHSAKPLEVKHRIVKLMGEVPRIELFSRDHTPGWDALGFDVDGKDIRDSLKELAG